MAKIITVAGKGGTGKTTMMALLLDELARFGYSGRILAVDGDPAMTLYMALGLPEPLATVATVRDSVKLDARTIRNLPENMTPAEYVMQQLQATHVLNSHKQRGINLDMMAMGWGEGTPSCYCSINAMLGLVLEQIVAHYDLIVVDNEAGLEHLSRYRIKQVDLFLTVVTDNQASQVVAERLMRVATSVGMEIKKTLQVRIVSPNAAGRTAMHDDVLIPYSQDVNDLMISGRVTELDRCHPVRLALRPLVIQALALGGHNAIQALRKSAGQLLRPVEGG